MHHSKILWLSDIHFQENLRDLSTPYSDILTDKYPNFLNKFFEIVEASHKDTPFNYIIISGDLAFSGSVDEYNKLNETIIIRIKQSIPNTPIFTIVGNHDVNYQMSKADWYKLFDKKLIAVKEKFRNKEQDLKNKETMYNNIFFQYTAFFKDNIRHTILDKNYLKIIDNNISTTTSSYKDFGLYGLIVDEHSKMLFVLINSSYFSYGNSVDELIEELLTLNEVSEATKITTAIDLKNLMTEYGTQMIGEVFLEKMQVVRKIKEYKSRNYKVFTVSHHPPNWLEYSERYSYEFDSKTLLQQILDLTDVYLTGHEHEPITAKAIPLESGNGFHFRASMFLPDRMKNKASFAENFPQSGFSILNFNESNIQEQRFFYTSMNKWEIANQHKYDFQSKEPSKLIAPISKDEIIARIKELD